MVELVYCATPARLKNSIPEIRAYVLERGFAPLHPFLALPYEDFEGNQNVGREPTMEYCCRLVGVSDRFWAFGVSDGVLREAKYAASIGKPRELHLSMDLRWKEFYDQLAEKYDRPLDDLLQDV